jgi:hypothetical protein
MLIKLKIEYHSGNFIPVAFRSGEFRGTFRYQFRNARIPPERETTGMAVLAEPSANFHSSGIHRNPPESPESGRNQWGITKTSIPYGFLVEIPCGMVEFTWNPHGIHMEYRWKEITKMGEISAKTYSMWNGQIPCGTTRIPYGFHMDSMWNRGAG